MFSNLIHKKGHKFHTKFVNKYGIAHKCDFYPNLFVSDITQINFNDYSNISSGSLVYVISSALKSWFREVYPILVKEKKIIILVTGDSVVNAPLEALGMNINELQNLKGEGVIYHWFCQNCDVDFRDYVTPIPLGVDYHTIHRKDFWGEKKTHFIFQDINLNLISRKRFDDFHKRKFRLICDIHLNKGNFNKERQIAYKQSKNIKNSLFINKPYSRSKFWRIMRDAQYIISPRGRGFDCHRTWEALVLGVVPIIKTSVNDVLFEEMPVLIVDSYKEINNNLLNKNKIFIHQNLKKITLQYWVNLIQTKKMILNKKIYKKSNKKISINKSYPLSIFNYFIKDLVLMILANPFIIVLFLKRLAILLFYPLLIFKEIILLVIQSLIDLI
ncbi:hypothetical protein HA149_06950 [Prochlorococcus marinus XMU1406]|uniref:hypothetical protein n=1 Tax=Prochlorococcus marinus TaxID=1219 RepID=UPI001ADD3863|nr:hypothetical protein [Prochlorococcus marinus]MBO8206794.1 hypothetical protein [Prochlorococcus marinus XMU1406]MCR8542613.1 hypothetical protein [Prochlorococcus marinus XMU1427]